MTRRLSILVLGTALAILASPPDIFAGRGGGGGGGGGYRGGGGGGYRGGAGGMGASPSFSQPRQSTGQSGSHPQSQYGNLSGASNHPAGTAAAGAGYANRNQSQSHPAGAAAAGAGYANNNQSLNHPGAAGAAAGAGYANNNQSLNHPGAAGAAAGAGYANNHSGINGAWNGNGYGAWGATGYGAGYGGGYGGVGAWGVGSPMYGWGYSGYSNPYSAGYSGAGGVAQPAAAQQPGGANQQAYNYSQPISTTAAQPDQAVAGQANTAFDQARDAFKSGDYAKALQLDQQGISQTPNDRTLHEFLALVFFAQGKYDQAAEPLYAVLSVAPGWDWTTLSGMYPDVDTYTGQLRALEANVRANPASAHARFVLAYQYLCQGHVENAVAQLKETVKLQPGDTLSAQLIAYYQPAGSAQPPSAEPATNGATAFDGKLAGSWVATPAKDTKIALVIGDDGKFNWDASSAGKPPTAIAGSSTLADGVLTLAAQGSQNGALTGKVAWQDADHFTFRVTGAPPSDPGLKFAR